MGHCLAMFTCLKWIYLCNIKYMQNENTALCVSIDIIINKKEQKNVEW